MLDAIALTRAKFSEAGMESCVDGVMGWTLSLFLESRLRGGSLALMTWKHAKCHGPLPVIAEVRVCDPHICFLLTLSTLCWI